MKLEEDAFQCIYRAAWKPVNEWTECGVRYSPRLHAQGCSAAVFRFVICAQNALIVSMTCASFLHKLTESRRTEHVIHCSCLNYSSYRSFFFFVNRLDILVSWVLKLIMDLLIRY